MTETPGGATGVDTTPAATAADESADGSVTVVGTAHVSSRSAEEVEATIERERPDVVAVELDEGRYRRLNGETPDNLDAGDLLRGNTVFQFLAYWILSYVQTQLGDRFDIEPGADMNAAVETAEGLGIDIALVDRNIQTTIQRFWARMTVMEKLRMVGGLAFGATDPRVVGITAGVLIGLVAGPLIGLFGGSIGITTGMLTSVTAGVAAAILTGVLVDQVGKAALSPDGRLYAAAALGPLTGLFVALSGVADGAVAATVGDLTVRAVGSLGIGLTAGLSIGLAAVAVLGAFGRLDQPSAGPADGIEELDLDTLTDTDVVTMMIDEFRRFSPGGAEALIDERDAFISRRLVALRDAGNDVVAVVGAGHRAGIERYLETPEALPPESSLVGTAGSRGVPWKRVVGYGITVAFVGFFVLLAMAGVRNGFLLRLFGAWFLINGVFAFGFAKAAGARWSSAGVGGAVAWMTSINPLLAPGWFTGYVELRHLTVNVADIERLNGLLSDESQSPGELISRMLDVPLFRLIVVVAMTNVGSIVASLLFAVYVLPAMFGAEVGSVDEVTRLMVDGARNSVELLQGLLG